MVRRAREERINHNAGMIRNQRPRNETIRGAITGEGAVRDIVRGGGGVRHAQGGSEPTAGSEGELEGEGIEGKLQRLRVKHLTDLWRESDSGAGLQKRP